MEQESKNESNSTLKRIDQGYISHEIQHLLHFDKGFLFTIKSLLFRPGKSIREFLFVDRTNYVKPILFLIITSVLFSLIIHWVDAGFSFFNIDAVIPLKGKLRSKEIGEWTNTHIGYSQLIMGIFIAFWIKILFKKFQYNIYEILVLLSFVLGEALLILGLLLVIVYLIKSSTMGVVSICVYFIYIFWAIGQFFGEKKIINYVKSILVYLLGNITYMTALILIAYLLKFV